MNWFHLLAPYISLKLLGYLFEDLLCKIAFLDAFVVWHKLDNIATYLLQRRVLDFVFIAI